MALQSKVEKVYEATALKIQEFSQETPEVADLAFELAEEFEKIDPLFDIHAFMAIAQPD